MNNNYYKLFIISIFLLGSTAVQSQDPNFHIYLLFGQSNMEGNGTIESIDRAGVDARFKVMGATNCTGSRSFTKGQWTTATPPLVRCYTGLGIADYFGRTMVAELPEPIKVGVVPVAVGGCDIILFDKDNYEEYATSASRPSWMKESIEAYGGNPYGRLVEVARLAQKDGVIKGILFHQGETNTNNTTWKNRVKKIVEDLKVDLELDDIPFLAGEMLSGTGSCCSSHNVEVNKLPGLITNAHVISSEGLVGADNAHFNSASYRTFGERYATKMLELIEVNPVTAVGDLALEQVSIYPVPVVNGSVTIQNIEKIRRIELFNMMGQKISSFENTHILSSVDFQVKANPGILLFKLFDGKSVVYKKVLVQ